MSRFFEDKKAPVNTGALIKNNEVINVDPNLRIPA